jgi:hypothetical protein
VAPRGSVKNVKTMGTKRGVGSGGHGDGEATWSKSKFQKLPGLEWVGDGRLLPSSPISDSSDSGAGYRTVSGASRRPQRKTSPGKSRRVGDGRSGGEPKADVQICWMGTTVTWGPESTNRGSFDVLFALQVEFDRMAVSGFPLSWLWCCSCW